MKIKDVGEIGLIKNLAKSLRYDRSVLLGVGDDAAVISWKRDKHLLLTSDMLIEGVHFTMKGATPFQIGWKALGRNISDIAAMGGIPRHALVSIGIAPDLPHTVFRGIYKGMKAIADKFDINIVGGDTSRSSKLVIDVALTGEVEKRCLTTRGTARVGDAIFVTGSLGGSIKGHHLNFTPRLAEARYITQHFKVNSMIDVSDGLGLDLWRILDRSGVGCRIYENTIPLSEEAGSLEDALSDGEDFELLFTVGPAEARRFLRKAVTEMETPVTLIGEVMERRYGYLLIDEEGRKKRLSPKGYLHF